MLQLLSGAPSLIDRTYDQVLAAITDGTLAPGQRIRQAELADSLGVSRQPISHALHLLKRQGLVQDSGKKGLRIVPLDPLRVLQLYQMREAVDGLAARLAASRVAAGIAETALIASLRRQVDAGAVFDHTTPVPVLVRADTDFHRALYRLSGNPVIEEMTASSWPHFMRSMAALLADPAYAGRVWRTEHQAILSHIEIGAPAAAEAAARGHAAAAADRTARRLQPEAA